MQRYEHGGDIYSRNIRLDFSVNTNALGMPPAAEAAVKDGGETYRRYPDPQYRLLRKALAEHHSIPENYILCGNGAADCIFRIFAGLRPKHVLLTAPTFSEYERPAVMFGAEIHEFPLKEEDGFLLPADFACRIPEGIDFIFLCSPNNPTGRLIPPAVMEALLETCRERNITLAVDECFIGFTEGKTLLPRLTEYPNLLVLRAFTKLYCMAGLRLGYLCGNPALLEKIAPWGAEWSVSGPAQAAGTAALNADPEWTEKTVAYTKAEREYMTAELRKLGFTVFPSETNYLLLKHEFPVREALLEKGIALRNCSNYSGLDERFSRIGLRTREENNELLQALREVLHGK